MKKYAHVYFKPTGEKGAILQNTLIRDMNELGIITVDEEWMVRQYNEDRKSTVRSEHHYVLHNLKEIHNFRKMMRSLKYRNFQKDIQWNVTWRKGNAKFKEWLENKGGS